MFVGIAVLDLHLPHAHDLKAKRRIVKGLVDRIHARFRVSVAETGDQELRQRARIGIAVVGHDESDVEHRLDAIREMAEQTAGAVVLDWSPSIVAEKE